MPINYCQYLDAELLLSVLVKDIMFIQVWNKGITQSAIGWTANLNCVAICRHIEYGKVLLVWFWHVPLLLVAGSEMVKVIPLKKIMYNPEFFQTIGVYSSWRHIVYILFLAHLAYKLNVRLCSHIFKQWAQKLKELVYLSSLGKFQLFAIKM